ncbi:choice-of-anchor B family protein [Aquimarina sp. MMG015]|uniref:choice-of-anchor B family protein n=1 Tax=Aquimarina TaxID=290174 RepID=UPI0004002526|nr:MULTISPECIES: choice-of-anchor B family protein [Aquimarina]MBQ4801505.1 choice-of-anchor B family protein [Aquimarina sp. MMG015]
MQKKTLLSFLFLSFILQSQTICENGMAGSFPCNDYDLMSQISLSTMNANEGSDSWGWTDSIDGKEYAIIGLDNGTAFIDISDPLSPIYLGKLPSAVGSSSWRDVKVYQNHAYIVADFISSGSHGMQVFDLTRLRSITNPPQTFTEDNRYTGFGNAHNIVINEGSGFAYAVGTSRSGTYQGGPLFIDIRDPKNPVAAGGFLSTGGEAYSHDAQAVIYNGPDTDYTGREILIGSNEIEIVIADITDKSNPVTISTIGYSDIGYVHQGWFTEDQRYFLLGDEGDESRVGFNTRTIIFDFNDLDNPAFHMNYTGPTPAIDHNGYVKGNKFYMANYRAGLRVLDISDIANNNVTEIGSFDTYPSSNSAAFNGAWSIYPYFESGNIVISDIERGFLLVRQTNTLSVNDFEEKSNFAIYPNPTNSSITIDGGDIKGLEKIEIYNVIGKKIEEFHNPDNAKNITLSLAYAPGIYLIKINDVTKKLIVK